MTASEQFSQKSLSQFCDLLTVLTFAANYTLNCFFNGGALNRNLEWIAPPAERTAEIRRNFRPSVCSLTLVDKLVEFWLKFGGNFRPSVHPSEIWRNSVRPGLSTIGGAIHTDVRLAQGHWKKEPTPKENDNLTEF